MIFLDFEALVKQGALKIVQIKGVLENFMGQGEYTFLSVVEKIRYN
jgi:hypothetical protein